MTTPTQTAIELIQRYDLAPHPEGGFFRETYRATDVWQGPSLPRRFAGPRAASTAILFLLPAGSASHLHRIASDEVWHFYLGGPLELIELHEQDTSVKRVVLGTDLAAGQLVQHVVPAGAWFGARPLAGSPYAFVGCTVAPGFDFADFELGQRRDLLARFPAGAPYIEALT